MLIRRHIRVPKTYDPGQGRPREHLAYLNKGEQELLRVLTDGVVEAGPKGIPSFAITHDGTNTSAPVRSGAAGMAAARPATASVTGQGTSGNRQTGATASTSRSGAAGMSAAKTVSAPKPAAPSAPRAPAASAAAAKASADRKSVV